LDEIEAARVGLARIEGVMTGDSVFGEGDAYWVSGKQIAHLREPGVFELRLTKPEIVRRRAALRVEERIELRSGASDWIRVRVPSAKDVELLLELAAVAAAAHRAPAGVAPKLPPTGADLERRRRFH
jgi:hypothetical protein